MKLPLWMRVAMGATALMNLGGAYAFLPSAQPLRAIVGLPEAGHPLYPTTVGLFIFLFGLAYLWVAASGRAERLFVGLAAAGKLSFFGLLVLFWSVGQLPLKAALSGAGDLLFGVHFLFWLYRARYV